MAGRVLMARVFQLHPGKSCYCTASMDNRSMCACDQHNPCLVPSSIVLAGLRTAGDFGPVKHVHALNGALTKTSGKVHGSERHQFTANT
eukprot:1157888-Pelagomonas_calceolata.AAC.2